MACRPARLLPFALGAGASFGSTLGSTWLIRQVERDRSLLALRRLPARAGGIGAAPPAPARPLAAPRSGAMYDNGAVTDAYAAAGVDTHEADRGVAALVDVLRGIDPGAPR